MPSMGSSPPPGAHFTAFVSGVTTSASSTEDGCRCLTHPAELTAGSSREQRMFWALKGRRRGPDCP